MILDLDNFIRKEQAYWNELENTLKKLDTEPVKRRTLVEVRRFHYLFGRASTDLSKIKTFSGQPEVKDYLEQLVARAYIQLHGDRGKAFAVSPVRWFFRTWPQTFRRHAGAFWLAVLVSMIGAIFGGFVLDRDSENMHALIPAQFAHVLEDPSERVREEEAIASSGADHLAGGKSEFAGALMYNNIKVTIRAMAFGILYGVLSIVVLFYNGVILGAVVTDFFRAGEAEFLLGWLLPHGVPELTAIFMGGQGGLVLARAMFGWGSELGFRARLRQVRGDLVTIICGCALMLVWAGIIEAFFSQYHYPVIAYSTKITFGVVELVVMVTFLAFCGRLAENQTGMVEAR